MREKRKGMPLWQELPLLLIVAFCVAVLVRTFLVQAFYIPSTSMEPMLLVGDRVLVNKVVYDFRTPARGETVVFRGTDNWAPEVPQQTSSGVMAKVGRTLGDLVGFSKPGEMDFIKRVIALPGDTVYCCDPTDPLGRVVVNGYPLDEPYVTDNSPLDVPPSPGECRSRKFGPVTIGPGQMWMMGDHRAVSQDSRCRGPVPIKNAIGRAFLTVWPADRWTGIGVPKTFANVPRAAAAGPAFRPATDGGLPDGGLPGGDLTGAGVPVLALPITASLIVPARSRPMRRLRRRTLPP